jgi:hypothetical protein
VTESAHDPQPQLQRTREVKRNIRRTAAVLWVIVAAIFFYMISKYYWMAK